MVTRKTVDYHMANFKDFQDLPSYIRLCQDDTQVHRIQQKLANLLKWNRLGFPGSVPVSLNKQNLNRFLTENYRVMAKLDGVRFLFLIDKKDAHYMINRNNQVFQVSGISAFPQQQGSPPTPSKYLHDTVFDVELMKIKTKEKEVYFFKLYVFDFIVLNGEYVGNRGLEQRLKIFQQCVQKPHFRLLQEKSNCKILEPEAKEDSITFEVNGLFPLGEAKSLWKKKQVLEHDLELDGLIFVDLNKAYNYYPRILGANDSCLRWKPQEVNTVDFRLEISSNLSAPSTGSLMLKGLEEPYATIELTPELLSLNGKVIECSYDKEKRSWRFYRGRWDKDVPNSMEIVENILSSIEDGVDETGLFEFIERHFESPDLK